MKTVSKSNTASHSNSQSSKPFFSKSGEGTFFSDSKEVKPPFFIPSRIQTKLTVGEPGDKYEQEADLMAENVVQKLGETKLSSPTHSKCENCDQEENLQRMEGKEEGEMKIDRKPIFESEDTSDSSLIQGKEIEETNFDIETQLQNSKGGGQSFDSKTKADMEQSFGADFSNVNIHTGSNAIQMNQKLGARAFTNRNDIYFNQGNYNPSTREGKKLLAHELTHVVQQSGGLSTSKIGMIQRSIALPKTTRVASFIPLGIIGEGNMKRLSIFIKANDTINSIAEKILSLWNNAAAGDVAGTPAQSIQITKEQLAKALLINNRYYLAIPPNLAIPKMTNWKVGLRFPIPVLINRITGEGMVNIGQIIRQANGFDSKWAPLLDQKPKAAEILSQEERQKQAGQILSSKDSHDIKGMSLAWRALKNTTEMLPLVQETFSQASSQVKFELALGFMDALVDFQFDLLAADTSGSAILETVKSAMTNTPTRLSESQKESLKRAQRMFTRFGLFSAAKGEAFKQTYIREVPGSNCMTAFYKGVGALYDKPYSEALSKQVYSEAKAKERRTGIDTNHVIRIMETLKSKGKAGPAIDLNYRRSTKTWVPDPETTILSKTHPNLAGWYFFGFSVHGGYHSVILAVDKTDIANPKIFWMDQFTKGFTKEVTGKLVEEMKNWKPDYGFSTTKLWQMIPAANTIIELN